jgi:poly-gamma-glutamate synthesis protein (capsule biosynthesis protein)
MSSSLDRRRWLRWLGAGTLAALARPLRASAGPQTHPAGGTQAAETAKGLTLFLCGDLMCGRGIDQILPTPGDPRLHEPHLQNARDYLALAERLNGPIPRPVAFDYVWGDALSEMDRVGPDLRIVNLETAVTVQDTPWPKGINYRMHPANTPLLTRIGIDCCVLANNHVLDWMAEGLLETLNALHGAGIQTAGAGRDLASACAPAIFPMAGGGCLLVFAVAERYSGVARDWRATESTPGIFLLPDLSRDSQQALAAQIARFRQPGDLVLVSIHWGGNWGYAIPRPSAALRMA